MTIFGLDSSEYPFKSSYFAINGQKLHYIDEGEGETFLFVHGTPSWSFDFRYIIKRLKHHCRCVAIDHIGFGLSDKPKNYDYSTQNHSKTLEKFVLEKNLDNITLAVHDFGGVIGLDFAIKHPEKIKRLIIFNSWLWSSNNDPDFVKLKMILKNPILPFLYLYLNFSPKYILPQSFGNKKLPKHLLKYYTRPFKNASQRHGVLEFANSLINDQEWFEQLWNKREIISTKPTLFVWGMKDPVIKPHNLEKFEAELTNSITLKLETCGHFPQEEEPEKVINAIFDFLINRKFKPKEV